MSYAAHRPIDEIRAIERARFHRRQPSAEYVNLQARRAAIEALRIAPRDPCFMCGTRADLGCKHMEQHA